MASNTDDEELDFEDGEDYAQTTINPLSDPVKDSFLSLLQHVQLLGRSVASKDLANTLQETLKDPTKTWAGVLSELTQEQETILHLLAQHQTQEKWLRRLTGIIMNRCSFLIGQSDRRRRYPLSLAIKEGNIAFLDGLKVMPKAEERKKAIRENIRKSLRNECQDGRDNFLHEAMSSQDLTSAHKIILIEIAPEEAFCSLDSTGLTPLHQAVAYENCSIDQDQVVNQLLSKGPSRTMDTETRGGHSVYEYHESTRRSRIRRVPTMRSNEVYAESNEAKQKTSDKEREEVAERGHSLTAGEFRKNFKDIVLEPVLKYVAFPDVSIKIDMMSMEDEELREDNSIMGREDMIFFFKWLRGKGVKQVLNVCVDDSKQPHSDEAVEQALKGLQIEVLDWKKVDLCSECILRVGDSVHTLRLQWSGNNLALRAWSELEGLARLPKLKHLIISQCEQTDSPQRDQDNKEEFRRRFEHSWKEMKITPPTIRWVHDYTPGTTETMAEGGTKQAIQEIYSDSWIKCLETFRKRVPRFIDSQVASSLVKSGLGARIVVAVIDDGMDKMHPDLNTYEFTGSSFHSYDDGQKVSPYWNSSAGHGTLMARLIHRIAPNVRLHVCRLQTRVSENGTAIQIEAQSAVDVINNAVDQGVRIISISWTISRPENELVRKRFRTAIERALTNKIHVFCSVSDRGQGADETYLLNSGPSEIFRIGAAKASGLIWEYVGKPTRLDFACPGHEVLMKEPAAADGIVQFKAYTGSSVATALASGLAALILECVRLGCVYDLETAKPEDTLRLDIRDWELIQTIGTSAGTDDKFLAVEKLFDVYSKTLQSESADGKLQKISLLARHFLRKTS
ncbi:hypothetical protein BJX70DRAFT_410989 [Aspergillus crustosus]